MDIGLFTSKLVMKDGIYFSKDTSEISYPDQGNDDFFQIEENSYWFRHRNRCIIEGVKKFAQGKVFFDVGGGNGFVSKHLQENGVETVLVEPGISGCINAKKYGLNNIVCSTLQQAQFAPDSLPSVGLFDVLEHVEDDMSFLKLIHHNLMPGGRVFITVPAYEVLWSQEDSDAGHFRRYTRKRLNKKLAETGFEVEFSSYLFSILPVPIFLFRTIPSKLGFDRPHKLRRHKKHHRTSSRLFTKIVNSILDREVRRIIQNKENPFGSSSFIVARKK